MKTVLLDAVLVLKVALAPALILVASVAGDRWGHTVSGWIVSLPLTSAPVIFLLALEQGVGFASSSAGGTMLGLVSLSAFSLAYSWLSLYLRISWLYSMTLGWCVFFLFSFILANVSVPLVASFVGVVAWLFLVARFFPETNHLSEPAAPGVYTRWDIAVRIVATEALILVVTGNAPLLGPRLSGLLTPFPIYTSVLASSIHRREGAASAVQFVRGATVGLFTPAIFFLIVGTLIVGWGVGASYALAIAASLIVHGLLLRSLRK
jgi:hypothetical protein